jgi:hypothetical protein
MAITNYHTVNGEMIGETTSAARTGYLTDGLGSVTATQSSTGNVSTTYRYKPYGSLLAKTGAGLDPRFLWKGARGYRIGSAAIFTYVRARHLCASLGLWTSRDQLWPQELAFSYANLNPVTLYDPTGSAVNHLLATDVEHVGCAEFTMIWTFSDKLDRKQLFLKQRVDLKGTCYDCSTKKPCKLTTAHRLELLKFSGRNKAGKLKVTDEWGLTAPPRGNGLNWFCTRGSWTISATHEVIANHAYPPTITSKEPWLPLYEKNKAGKEETVGYAIHGYAGSWKGSLTRKVVYEWDCCLKPAWSRITVTATEFNGVPYIVQSHAVKPKVNRTCPEKRGAGSAT